MAKPSRKSPKPPGVPPTSLKRRSAISSRISNRRLQAGTRNLCQRHHIHLYVQLVPGAPEENAVDRTDVRVIASPSDGDVTVGGYAIVGGIEVHPPGPGAP